LKILLVDGQVINDADPEKKITNTMVMLRQIQKVLSYEGTFIGSGALTVSEALQQ
jgi:hypothetical protein